MPWVLTQMTLLQISSGGLVWLYYRRNPVLCRPGLKTPVLCRGAYLWTTHLCSSIYKPHFFVLLSRNYPPLFIYLWPYLICSSIYELLSFVLLLWFVPIVPIVLICINYQHLSWYKCSTNICSDLYCILSFFYVWTSHIYSFIY